MRIAADLAEYRVPAGETENLLDIRHPALRDGGTRDLAEEKSPKVCCGQVLLGHERDCGAVLQHLRRHMIKIRGCQHDPGSWASSRERPGHGKAVRVWKAYVQEYPARTPPGHGRQRLFTVPSLFEQVETACGEQFSRHHTKARAVVNNQDPNGHVTYPDG
jgi:hypothetical protein